MKKFVYKLETILDLRAHHEREWEMKLAEITGLCMRLKHEIGRLEGEKIGLSRERAPEGPLDMETMRSMELYRERLEREILALTSDLEVKEERRTTVQAGYVEASKEKRVLEKLKERKAEAFRRGLLKQEARVLDDVTSSESARRNARG